ncbi:DUF4194 domain-containing protein [Pseudomonas nicosulfuronedens]
MDFFDELTAAEGSEVAPRPASQAPEPAIGAAPTTGTEREIKEACQELLRLGLLEATRKPNLYRTAVARADALNRVFEPLDLLMRIDDVRGLAYLRVLPGDAPTAGEEADEWAHPLVRRQRLTLEQSLLVALLRQHYVAYEQEAGVGADDARMALDDLLPLLPLYLGELGSDALERKRLSALLEKLKAHGIVSDVDSQEQVWIRPIIVHMANPESLQALLQALREQGGARVLASDSAEEGEQP